MISSKLPLTVIDDSVEREQVSRLQAFRVKRARDRRRALSALDDTARSKKNLMPLIVDAVRDECTFAEIVNPLKKTLGEHREQGFRSLMRNS